MPDEKSIRVTKSELQMKMGCTRKQAVEFKKNTTYSREELSQELARVKKEFPSGGKKKKPEEVATV